ncbi:MAG: response regulator [Chryseolinea sp.]
MTQQSRTIFLAEDDEDDCLIFLEALLELNCQLEIVVSRDGDELMMNLDKRVPPPPYVLFLDLNMPLKNGFDCLMEIKQIDKMKGVPIVVLSTSVEIKDINKAYLLGANYYMPKPDCFSKLVEGIKKILQFDLSSRLPKQEFILQS